MKHMKFSFIAVALIAILSAFATKENSSSMSLRKYAFLEKKTVFVDGANREIITIKDITGQTEGTEYDCVPDETICTFVADDQYFRSAVSETGGLPYVWTSEVNPTLSTPLHAQNVVDDALFIEND